MISIGEFRESYINETIIASAINDERYPIEVFIDNAIDILVNDYQLISEMSHCYFEFSKGNRAYKSMRIDAADLDLSSNTLNLLYADFNESIAKNITNEFISKKSELMLNYLENVLKGYFNDGEPADPAVQLAKNIRANIEAIGTIHLFIASTNSLSNVVKKLPKGKFVFNDLTLMVIIDVLDIEKIYKAQTVGFEKEDLVIDCNDYGISGIPCIKADIDTDQYESYLAIVPGAFLSNIYKAYGPSLLESNVRSFLKFNGAVNKGIRNTILNEKSRFFTYNNGISTTASSVQIINDGHSDLITSFTNLQIINGGQTTATLAASTIKNAADLSGIYVQMKLTILKESNPELIRNIARYANSQNAVKTADLNSSHPYYVRIESFSRKIYAPLASGEIYMKLWFFERTRGQYEQPLMQMTKKQSKDYKLIRPRAMKFTLTDLAKYVNAADMLPHYVSWGGQVNASHFHDNMIKQWEKDNSTFDENYYKELIGMKILYTQIGKIVSAQQWFQEKRAYRPQIIAYTFSKLVYEAKKYNKYINYRKFWDIQSIPSSLELDIANIAKIVFDTINDDNRVNANIETYCKKVECWKEVQKRDYVLSSNANESLITKSEMAINAEQSKKDKGLELVELNEIMVFQRGSFYWNSILEQLKNANKLSTSYEEALSCAIDYCNLISPELPLDKLSVMQEIVKELQL